jgi:hypothetical protein
MGPACSPEHPRHYHTSHHHIGSIVKHSRAKLETQQAEMHVTTAIPRELGTSWVLRWNNFASSTTLGSSAFVMTLQVINKMLIDAVNQYLPI